MEKLFKKDEIWFAVVWIIVYVISFSAADSVSEEIGIPKLITCAVGLVMALIAYGFIKKQQLKEYYGLCGMREPVKKYFYFFPLIIISSVNLWNGIEIKSSSSEILLFMISMCFVAFIEEVIFRGFLFKAMCKDNVTVAIIVSSVTFGIGHIVNLLMGEPLLDTMLQLVYASAVGFCFTAVFYVSGSILPCILAHALTNSLSIISIVPSKEMHIVTTVVLTVISILYGVWLLLTDKKKKIYF